MIPLFVGYQLRSDSRLINAILRHKDQVREVYFAWPGIANGRSVLSQKLDLSAWEALDRQRADLARLSEAGIGLNLLLNGNCYGAEALSRSFFTGIGDLIDAIAAQYGLSSVTTASPVIARFVKQNFEELEVRASVNMEIGTREGVEYLADWMDGFYIKREMNRSIDQVREFAKICHSMGKRVYLLANSGCLNHCSARVFHDNLVSHEAELMKMDNAFVFNGMCRQFLADPEKRKRILQISNWIRPEDLSRYEGIVDGAKLATRVSENPEMIVHAYVGGHFPGNLLALTEPDFSAIYRPIALSGSRMPHDFFDQTSSCQRKCEGCGYCIRAFEQAAEDLSQYENIETK